MRVDIGRRAEVVDVGVGLSPSSYAKVMGVSKLVVGVLE